MISTGCSMYCVICGAGAKQLEAFRILRDLEPAQNSSGRLESPSLMQTRMAKDAGPSRSGCVTGCVIVCLWPIAAGKMAGRLQQQEHWGRAKEEGRGWRSKGAARVPPPLEWLQQPGGEG